MQAIVSKDTGAAQAKLVLLLLPEPALLQRV